MRNITKILFIAILTSLISSCSLNIKLEDQFSDPDAISNVETARELLADIYDSYPKYYYELSVLSDDFHPSNLIDKDANLKSLYLWQDKYISDASVRYWEEYYYSIALCNTLIERLPLIIITSQQDKEELNKINSEVLTLKALCYFDLLRLFAPDYAQGATKDGIILKDKLALEFGSRASIEQCVEEIERLLTEASKTENKTTASGWLSTTACNYILADLALYSHKWQKSIDYANKALETSNSAVLEETNYAQLWSKENCKERIFAHYIAKPFYKDIQYSANEGDYFVINSNINYYKGDIREEFSIYKYKMIDNNSEKIDVDGVGKYNKMNRETKDIKYVNRIRYSGLYFIIAQAYYHLAKNDKAIETINIYLAKRKAKLIDSNSSGETLLSQILDEKQKEYIGEGERFFDLKRTNKADLKRYSAFGKNVSTNIKANDYRWTFPIPKSEYKYNPNISQNSGWTKEN